MMIFMIFFCKIKNDAHRAIFERYVDGNFVSHKRLSVICLQVP